MVQPSQLGYKGGCISTPPCISGEYMARRNISAKRHGRKFNKAKNKTRKINTPNHVMRGGIRL